VKRRTQGAGRAGRWGCVRVVKNQCLQRTGAEQESETYHVSRLWSALGLAFYRRSSASGSDQTRKSRHEQMFSAPHPAADISPTAGHARWAQW